MALLFLDGFDKYGGVNSNTTSVAALMAGEWTAGSAAQITGPLSATGQALLVAAAGGPSKTLSASYGRIIGGYRFSTSLAAVSGIQFTDAGTNQFGISVAATGIISLRNGSYTAGTILGSSGSAISANTTHYLEWDITLGNSAAYNVYLDGVSVISGTGDTTATANNTINGFITGCSGAGTFVFDDLYLFDASGTTNNAVLLTSPRIETQLPNADSAVQFAIGASVLGQTAARVTTFYNGAANLFAVRPFTPTRNCTLNSISIGTSAASATVQVRPVVYADSSGVPGTLMSTGSVVVGTPASGVVTYPLTTPQSLTAGTQYWLGYMEDIVVTSGWALIDTAAAQYRTATATFSSGAPGTAPAVSASAANTNVVLWGNISGTGVNYYEVNQQPPAGVYSYVYDSTVTHEDLYNFPALSTPGAVIHSVAVKSFAQKSDAGTRTMSLRTKSSSTDSGGSLTGQALGTSFQWYGSFFPTDPNTSAAWTVANLNLATSGMRVDS